MAIIVSSSLFDNIDLSIAETVVFGGFIIFFFFFIRSIYRVYFHPLSHVPGPLLAKSTSLWLAWSNYKGDHHLTVHGLHHRYGTVVRLAPWEVSIADGAAQTAIYSQRRGFNKSSWYQNFDVDGHETIFSATSPTRRDRSAKAVLPLFSAQNIQHNASDIIDHAAATLARRVKAQAARQKEVDLLPLARAFAMDIMATYLFHHSPKTFDEDTGKLSVSGYITALAAASRFWYVPKRAFFALCAVADFFAEPETHRSTQAMKAYVAGVMANITPGDRSFQGLLADAGLSRSQIKAQCQDSFYAGVDPTYFSLASICHLLASNPDKYVSAVDDDPVSDMERNFWLAQMANNENADTSSCAKLFNATMLLLPHSSLPNFPTSPLSPKKAFVLPSLSLVACLAAFHPLGTRSTAMHYPAAPASACLCTRST